MTRTEYLAIAKIIRNAELPEDIKKKLVKDFSVFLELTTLHFDKKSFMHVAMMVLD